MDETLCWTHVKHPVAQNTKLPRSKSSLSWQKYEILGAYFYNREVQRVDRKWHGDLLNQASYGTVHSPLTEKPLANSMDDLRRL